MDSGVPSTGSARIGAGRFWDYLALPAAFGTIVAHLRTGWYNYFCKTMNDAYSIRLAKTELRDGYNTGNVDRILSRIQRRTRRSVHRLCFVLGAGGEGGFAPSA